jgi:hypothetical protein
MASTTCAGPSTLFEILTEAGTDGSEGGSQCACNSREHPSSRANNPTCQSRRIGLVRGKVSGKKFLSICIALAANASPSRLPTTLSTRPSIIASPSNVDPEAPRASRRAVFAKPADCPDQQQSSKIGTGDQQHDDYSEEEHADERAGLLYDFLLKRVENCANSQTRHECGIVLHNFLRHALDVGLCLLFSNSCLQPAKHLKSP